MGRKQLPYLALKGAIAFPADTEIQNIESVQERETVEEENSAKFPIGRRDFDSKYILLFLSLSLFLSLFFFFRLILVWFTLVCPKPFVKSPARSSM